MPLGILFWVLYILAIILGFWGYYEPAQPNWYRRGFGYLMVWILIGVLGWQVFGPAVSSAHHY